MKKYMVIISFLAICITVITFAIKAGRHHEDCRECQLAAKMK
ncbi:MAG: hypothetical protein ACXWWC_12960 [Chitinophagaceae bacterium]